MKLRCTLIYFLFLAWPCAVPADELSGEISIGQRNVSVDGAKNKYREDINLEDGARLTDLSLLFLGSNDDTLKPDRIELNAHNLGGDPFENLLLTIRKYQHYSFRAQRRRSAWFYDDIIVLPENASIPGSTGGDYHRFDVERVRDDLALSIHLNERTDLRMGFERNEKSGNSTTTLDVSRDEFELEKPVDELLQTWHLSVDYSWENAQLSLEERLYKYENHSEIFLPGFSVGQNAGDQTTLDFLFLNTPYSYRGHEHVARLTATPSDRVSLLLAATVGELNLDTQVEERLQGSDFTGMPLQITDSGGGEIARDTVALNLRTRYRLSDRFSLLAALRYRDLAQSGGVTFNATEGGVSRWDTELQSFDLGFTWQAARNLLVSAGWQSAQRRADALATQDGGMPRTVANKSDTDGLFLNIDYRPSERLRLSASLNDHSRDDPFSLASPEELTRFRVRATYRAANELRVIASHAQSDRKNDLGRWSATTRQSTLRLSRNAANLNWSVGGTIVDSSQDYQRLVSGGTRQDLFDIAYSADTHYVDAMLQRRLNERWSVGGYWRRYENGGSFDVGRDDWRGYIDIKLPQNYHLTVSYRRIDYEEGGLEQYDARIAEAVLRLAF